jgi:Carboxypeptidase regulatory-like domain
MARALYSVVLLLTISALTLAASPQPTIGTLSGTVIDPIGAVVPGATVTARNTATDQSFTVVTDVSGRFFFPSIPVGTYTVRVNMSGFASAVVQGVAINVGQAMQISVELSAGLAGETVGVHGDGKSSPKDKKSKWKGGETGRDLLVKGKNEVSGYGLYSYVLFAGHPTGESKPRYLAVLKACLDEIASIGGLESSGIPKNKLNVAYIPISNEPPKTVDENWVLDNYDYDRATALLAYLPEKYKRHQGPYLVSHTTPLAAESTGEFLYQDLSVVNERLATAWIKHFLDRASQERFWETNKAEDFALDLRNFVADTAPNIENIKAAAASWIQIFSK